MSPLVRRQPTHLACLASLLAACGCLFVGTANAADVDFYRDLYPVLKSNCIACHNKTTTKGGLNMESPEASRKGGESGEGLIPGKSTESLIFQAAAHVGDVEMPPKGNKTGALKLTPEQLALLKTWIDQGARDSIKQTKEVTWQPLPPGVHPIYTVALTRDGRFAACGRANQVFVYDLATRQLVTRLTEPSLDKHGSTETTGIAHKALVQSVALSPDGKRLASGSYRELKIWRREEHPSTNRKRNPDFSSVVSALSPDGKTLIGIDTQGIARLTDVSSGKTLKAITNDKFKSIQSMSISPDLTKIAIQQKDGTPSIVSLDDGQSIATKSPFSGVRVLNWTRDGKAIVTGGDDSAVRLWSLPERGKPELEVAKEYPGSTGAVTAIVTGPDVVIAASGDGKVRSWNMTSAKPILELPAPGVVALDLSSDGTRLVSGRADGVVEIWDLTTSKSVVQLSGDMETSSRLAALDWTVATQALEIAFQNQEVSRVEGQNKGLTELLKKTNDTVANVKKDLVEKQDSLKKASDATEAARKGVAEVGTQIAKATVGKPDATLEKTLKDGQDKLAAAAVAENTALAALKAQEIHLKDAEVEAQNYAVAQGRNKSNIASATDAIAKAKAIQDKASVDTAEIKKTKAQRKLQPLTVHFSTDSQTVAAVMNDGSIRVWAVASSVPVGQLPGQGPTASASIAGVGDGGFAITTADGSTSIINTTSRWVLERTIGGETAESPFADRVNALRFSPDGKILAAGGGEPTRSGDISLWDVESGGMITDWKERHTDAVLSLDFSLDGKRLASGGADKVARVTDIATGKIVNTLEGHTHHVLGVSFRADGRVIATAGGDGTVVVWDMISGERKKKVEGWSKEVTSLQFLGATNQILASSGDNQIRIVDDNGGQVRAMANLPDFMQSAAGAATSDLIVGGGEDGLFRLWNRTAGQELATFGVDSDMKKP